MISSNSRSASAFTGSISSRSASTRSSSRCRRHNARTAAASSSPMLRSCRTSAGLGRLAGSLPGLERQGHGVQRLARRIQQQVGDVKRAQLVFEDGLPAFEGEFPGSPPPAQGILVLHPGDCD